MHYKPWTTEEDKILKSLYDTEGAIRLSQRFNRTANSVQVHASKLGLGNKYRPRNTEIPHALIDQISPIGAYLLGFIWADGYISKRLNKITILIDKEDGNSLSPMILSTSELWKVYQIERQLASKIGRYTMFSCSNYWLRTFLVEHDYLSKSGISADKILSLIPPDLLHYWWRGYFDGDGCFSFTKDFTSKIAMRGIVTLTGDRFQDWTFVINLLEYLDIDYRYVINKHARGDNSCIRIQSESSILKFIDYIYQGEQFGLVRKMNKSIQFVEYKKKIKQSKTSKYYGVFRRNHKTLPWVMQVFHGRPIKEYFSDENEAAQRYNQLASELFGSRARLNIL